MKRISLSREILKWIQTLDLTYSVKDVKRDFANGFLVAEMISRYDKEIEMHSYNTGTSLRNRDDNWTLLSKYFIKKRIPITKDEIKAAIKNISGSTIPIVQKVYTYLTKRKVIERKHIVPEVVTLPAFQRPTVAKYLKEEGKRNINYSYKLPNLHYKYRTNLNDYYSKKGRKRKKKGMKQNESSSSLGKNYSTSHSIESDDYSLKEDDNNSKFSRYVPIREKLNNIVENLIGANIDLMIETNPSENKEFFDYFIDIIISGKVNKNQINTVFKAMKELLPLQTTIMLKTPSEFYDCCTVLCKGLRELKLSSGYFQNFVKLFEEFALSLKRKDSSTTFNYFVSFFLDTLISILKHSLPKRSWILRIIYSFCPNESIASSHLSIIRLLQQKLPNRRMFHNCLTFLVTLERRFSTPLLNSYIYYSFTGLRNTSPHIRASSLSMIATIASHGYDLVFNYIDKIERLLNDNWWEVQAQLIIVSSMLLKFMDPNKSFDECKRIYRFILVTLNKQLNHHVHTIAVCYLSKVIRIHKSLLPIYTKILLSLKRDHLNAVLFGSNGLELLGSALLGYASLDQQEELIESEMRRKNVIFGVKKSEEEIEKREFFSVNSGVNSTSSGGNGGNSKSGGRKLLILEESIDIKEDLNAEENGKIKDEKGDDEDEMSLLKKTMKPKQTRRVRTMRVGSSNLIYEISDITKTWDAPGIAKEMIKSILKKNLEVMESKHYKILKCCVFDLQKVREDFQKGLGKDEDEYSKSKTSTSKKSLKSSQKDPESLRDKLNKGTTSTTVAFGSNEEEGSKKRAKKKPTLLEKDVLFEWGKIFHSVESYLYIGLTDPKKSDIAKDLLLLFYNNLGEESLTNVVLLIRTIDITFNKKNKVNIMCKKNLTKLMINIYDLGGVFEKKMYQISKTLQERDFENSVLKHFLNHVKYGANFSRNEWE